ncbi:MAG TPA: 2-C-methyl-D-erythritol 4-phosphate cytidylyltransferase [Bacillus bacterium]|nr:2-C-methyl-D-erythritol 4-phosphate cytidylyltransferase [Bacillus sp. (in: firmicutes)]
MDYYVVIPAAGQGKRMNAGMNKQFIKLNNIPVIIHTLNVFDKDENCQGIILAVNEYEVNIFIELIREHHIKKVIKIVNGGKERQHSVYNGLKALRDQVENTIVLIHDGARPFIKKTTIHKLVRCAARYDGAVVAVPVKDTIKAVQNNIVQKTVERSSLWSVQTPQAFRLSVILAAHQDAENHHFLGTDDSSLVERLGKNVHIVIGDYENIKLTTQEDLLYGEAILANRGNNE